MCRNIKTLFNFEPPATDEEVAAASLQFVRKISGFTHPSKANEEAFDLAVEHSGNVWVSNSGGDTVIKLAPDCTLLAAFGLPGTQSAGTFKRPLGLAVDTFHFYVSGSSLQDLRQCRPRRRPAQESLGVSISPFPSPCLRAFA